MKLTPLTLVSTLLIFFSWLIMYILVPPFHTPDEPSHYENVMRLARGYYPYQVVDKTKKNILYVDQLEHLYTSPPFSPLKVAQSSLWHKNSYTAHEVRAVSKENFQSYHPFLYPLILAPFQFVAERLQMNLIDQYYFVRLANSLFYFASMYILYRILKHVIADEKKRVAALLVCALNPFVVKSFVGINPDNGVAFFSLLFLFGAVRIKTLNPVSVTVLAILAGCAFLSKLTGVALLLIFGYLFIAYPSRKYNKVLLSALALGIFALTIWPWIYLMLHRYHTLFTNAVVIAWNNALRPHPVWQSVLFGVLGLRHTIMHYAGFFGPQNNIYPSPFFFYGYIIFFILASVVGAVRSYKNTSLLVFIYTLSFLLFLSVLGFYFYRSGALWDIQGRYALAVFPLICYFVVESGVPYLLLIALSFLHFFVITIRMYMPSVCHTLTVSSCVTGLHPWFYAAWVTALVCWVLLQGVAIYLYARKQ